MGMLLLNAWAILPALHRSSTSTRLLTARGVCASDGTVHLVGPGGAVAVSVADAALLVGLVSVVPAAVATDTAFA